MLEKENNKKLLNYIVYIMVFIMSAGFLWHYLYISIGPIPLMDYWVGSGEALENIMTNQIQLNMFIKIPHALHWNPIGGFVNIFFVHFFGCDNRAYVYAGMLASFATIILLMYVYRKYLSSEKTLLNIVGIMVCVMPIINLNQWEILTLFANYVFMFRIFMYLLLIYFLDRFLHNYENSKKYLCKVVFFSIVNFFVILFMSQAYFVGLVIAEGSVIVIDYFIYKKKEKIRMYFMVLMSAGIASVIYYITLEKSSIQVIGENINLFHRVADYIQGLLIMLGSTVVPQTIALNNMSVSCEIGIIIFELSIMSVWLFFKSEMCKKTYFPIACLLYAFSSIIVIMVGRIYSYGLETLTSSRYVVETTIGLLGLLQIYWYCFCKMSMKLKYRLGIILVLLSIVLLICWANKMEMQAGPYRKAYNQSMAEIALDIENASDEQLSIFQSKPEYVREGIAAMKKYKLLLWKE